MRRSFIMRTCAGEPAQQAGIYFSLKRMRMFRNLFQIWFQNSYSEYQQKIIKRQSLKWSPEMVENLTESTQPFKASMTFKDLNFDTDKAAQYSAYRTEWLLFIVMMKLYLAQLKLQIGRRLLANCHRKIRVQCKKRLRYKKFWLWNERVGCWREQKTSRSHFPNSCRVHTVKVVN